MNATLKGKKVAVLVENGFEEVKLTEPVKALRAEGAEVKIVSPQQDRVRAWAKTDWGKNYEVDVHLEQASSTEFDALLLPGGVMNPDYLRVNDKAVKFVRSFFTDRKPIAAICHGPWTLIETGKLDGITLTSFPSLKTDLINAGATWVNEEVVVDQNLITSRKPDDIPAFCSRMVAEFNNT